MNRPANSIELQATAGSDWFAANDEVLERGLAWLRAQVQQSIDPNPASTSEFRAAYVTKRQYMLDAGRPCALDQLAGAFGLSEFDLDVLLVALGPQVDVELGALYRRVPACAGAPHASRALVDLLLCTCAASRSLARAQLAPGAPLRRHALIRLDHADAACPITLDERMVGLIHGLTDWDPQVGGVLRQLGHCVVPGGLLQDARRLARAIDASSGPAGQIVGPRRSGRHAVAQAVAAEFGLAPMQLDVRALPAGAAERRSLWGLVSREALLSRLCLVIDTGADTSGADEPVEDLALRAAQEATAAATAVTLVLSEDPAAGLGELPMVRLPPLGRDERAWCWNEALKLHAIEPQTLGDLADHFPFGLSRMVEVARSVAAAETPDRQALWNACRDRGATRLGGLARRVVSRRGWSDLVLPADVLADLHALADQVGRRGIVYGDWGYDALLPRGRGVSALFAGPSGVGKTLAAEVIAGELGLDLYCVDLATVVSKYIGETEKNLKRIFDAAEEAGAVLLIDEADALFGKRTEVKDSHDRYANIETSYLLQRIEQYDGLVVLATNMRSHLDFAFMRRLRYLVDFPYPGFDGRRALWRKAFPPAAPIDDIDFERLAQLELAGGNIIVIATNAAFLAATESARIGMRHIERAARAEFRKLDRLFDAQVLRGPA